MVPTVLEPPALAPAVLLVALAPPAPVLTPPLVVVLAALPGALDVAALVAPALVVPVPPAPGALVVAVLPIGSPPSSLHAAMNVMPSTTAHGAMAS
jgi:hypothetical protein